MKTFNFLMLFTLSAILVGCSDSSTTKKSSTSSTSNSNSNPSICTQYPYLAECTGSTTGATSGGSTTSSSGGGAQTVYTPLLENNNWGDLYQSGVPSGSCSSPTGTGYDLRKGTITIAGGTQYSSDLPWTSTFSQTTSYFLMNTQEAKAFFDTDAKLRVRLKVRPQPKAPAGTVYCFNRVTGQNSDSYGYTSLQFSVSLRGVNSNGTLDPYYRGTQTVTVGVNSCSPAIDFSGLNQQWPNGVVVVIHNVYSNQGCTYQSGCTTYKQVRAASCWSMDFEVSVDGTKDI